MTATAWSHVLLPGGCVNPLHFGIENTSLQQDSCLCVGRSKTSPPPHKKVFWGCHLLSHWWKSALPLCVYCFVCPALTELCPSVLSNKVFGSCCLAKTGNWITAIDIVFRTAWLTRRLKQETEVPTVQPVLKAENVEEPTPVHQAHLLAVGRNGG